MYRPWLRKWQWTHLWPLLLLGLLALLPIIPVGYVSAIPGDDQSQAHFLSIEEWLSGIAKRQLGSDLTNLFIFCILALGLNVVVGYTGLLNLGIAAFFGIGAYATGILSVPGYPFQWGFMATAIGAVAAATVAGLMLGAPTLRLRGDYLALVTLGFGEVVRFTLRNMEEFVGGTKGLNPILTPTYFPKKEEVQLGSRLIVDWLDWSGDYRCFYYLCFVILALVLLMLRNLERSSVGRSWVALREDELATSCMGMSATRIKLTAFALGAGLAGLAGCLYATKLTTTTQPDSFDFARSITILCCVILGGMGSLRGTVVGVFLLLGLDNILAPILDDTLMRLHRDGDASRLLTFKNWRLMIFGLALILMMRFRPEGLFPSRRVAEELHEEHGLPA